MADIDLTAYDITQLNELRSNIDAEFNRRKNLEDISGKITVLNQQYLQNRDGFVADATDAASYPEYLQPHGAYDSYPSGYVVKDSTGKLWKSIIDANVWNPEDATIPAEIKAKLWTEYDPSVNSGNEQPQNDTVPDWATGIDYSLGAKVKYNGKTYECILSHTSQSTWTPDVSATLWKLSI